MRLLWVSLSLALLVVLAGGCGDDGAPDADPSSSTEPGAATESVPSASSTPPPTSESTTTTAAPTSTILISGEIDSEDGTTGTYELSLTVDDLLCFEARLGNDDPDLALGLGTGVSECVGDDGPFTALDDALLASVGSVDGGGRYGYVWGRASAEVTDLVLVSEDASTLPVPLETTEGIGVFAIVVDTAVTADVATLDALGADGTLVASQNIRAFLRTGPTYPEVGPPESAPPPTYPATGG